MTLTRALLVACLAAAAHARRITMEPAAVPGRAPNWARAEPCGENHTVSGVFMLRHDEAKVAQLEQTLFEVSDPTHKNYGKHLSQKQVKTMFGNPAAVKTVLAWLTSEGVPNTATTVSATDDMIEFTVPAPTAERLFATKFHAFEHRARGIKLNRVVKSYSLPQAVADVVAVVGDILPLPSVPTLVTAEKQERVAAASSADWPMDCKTCGSVLQKWVTPAVLTQRYNLGAAPVKGATKGSMAVAEFQGVMWDKVDLEAFQKNCGLSINITVDVQIGNDAPLECRIPIVGTELCGEAMLDIEYIKAVGGGIPLTDIFNSQFSILKWMTQVTNMANPPLIHSVSYGNDEKQQVSKDYMYTCNVQFMKAGTRGLSVLIASGDQGVWGRSGTLGGKFHPDFPCSSPYVTAVGGTDFAKTSVVGDETTWADGGGGFSDTFASPAYQQAAVASFKSVSTNLPATTLWNQTGRGYPDVAALAGVKNPYCVRVGSASMGVGGTSAACPVVAGVFGKLNEVRLAKGGKPMGFLNPFIYQNPNGFFDVVSGENKGAGKEGFTAVKGWDAATGFGTPNFAALSKLV